MKISRSIIFALVLTIVASALYRIMPNRPMGFAPQIAIALFSGALCVKNKKWADLLYEEMAPSFKEQTGVIHSNKSQSLNHLLSSHLCPFVMDKKPKPLKRFRAIVWRIDKLLTA